MMSHPQLPDEKPKGYEAFLSHIRAFWQDQGPPTKEMMSGWMKEAEALMVAAGELTKDELALVREYITQDVHALLDAPGGYQDSAFYHALQDTAWEWLLSISDRTALEMHAAAEDLSHANGYQAGEWMAPGVKICILCGHHETLLHATELTPCLHCDGERFRRKALMP